MITEEVIQRSTAILFVILIITLLGLFIAYFFGFVGPSSTSVSSTKEIMKIETVLGQKQELGVLWIEKNTIFGKTGKIVHDTSVYGIVLPKRKDEFIRRMNVLGLNDNLWMFQAILGKDIPMAQMTNLGLFTDGFTKECIKRPNVGGCALSHIAVIYHFLHNQPNAKYGLILEDDVKIADGVTLEGIWGFLDRMNEKTTNWDMFYLGYKYEKSKIKRGEDISNHQDGDIWRLYAPLATHAYFITKTGARKILELLPYNKSVDNMYYDNIKAGNLIAYGVKNLMFIQDSKFFGSELGNGGVNDQFIYEKQNISNEEAMSLGTGVVIPVKNIGRSTIGFFGQINIMTSMNARQNGNSFITEEGFEPIICKYAGRRKNWDGAPLIMNGTGDLGKRYYHTLQTYFPGDKHPLYTKHDHQFIATYENLERLNEIRNGLNASFNEFFYIDPKFIETINQKVILPSKCLGIHIRSNEHYTKLMRSKFEDYMKIYTEVLDKELDSYDGCFVATCVGPALKFIQTRYGIKKPIYFYPQYLHENYSDDWYKNKASDEEVKESVVADVYLLSKCVHLVGGMSNVLYAALYLNTKATFTICPGLKASIGR